ncbi:MAG: pilus assembly protein PilM [Candidatus Omnitrophica bacterium]|nr:pilus assembly protein PilM [Candidatus Omnitrophota bacterium]
MKISPFLNKLLPAKKTQDFVAINLGNHSLKGLVIKENKPSDYFLEPAGEIPEQLKKIWKDKKISTDRVKISVKSPSCLVRYFPFLKMDKKKMKEALIYELSKHIPFSPDEVYFDFAVLEESSAQEVLLLLAIAKKDFIDSTIGTFEKQNLKIAEINLDSVCLTNVFLKAYEEHDKINSSILDIGYSSSTLTILRKGIPFLTRDLIFSSKDILQVLSNIKNIPLSEAEKWLSSLSDSREFLELVQGSLTNLTAQIKSSFDYFEVNRGERVEKMFLAGGMAQINGFKEVFKEPLGIEATLLDNLQNLDINFEDGKFGLIRNNFTVACGLIT